MNWLSDVVTKFKIEFPAATDPVKVLTSFALDASVTVIPTPYESPAAEMGIVPVMAPVAESRVKPVGKDPLVMAKLNGAMPPDVEIPVDTLPTLIPRIEDDTIETAAAGFAAIVPLNGRDCVCEAESVTLTVKL